MVLDTLTTVGSEFTESISGLKIVLTAGRARLRKTALGRIGIGKIMIYLIIAAVIFGYIFMGALTAQYLDNADFITDKTWAGIAILFWPIFLFGLLCVVLPIWLGVEFADKIDEAFK